MNCACAEKAIAAMAMKIALLTPAKRVCAPAANARADREKLPLPGMHWKNEETMFFSPWPRNS